MMDLPLEVLNDTILLDICARECGSKCCDFYLNDFHARVNIEDYKQLHRNDLQQFVIWDHGDPQLAKQPGGECIFLHPDTKQCSIYPVRPLDCRNFPYFMPEKNIADHCLLYYRSSKDLIRKQKAQTHDIPPFTKSYVELNPVEREYIANLQEQPSLDIDDIFDYEEEVRNDLQFLSIIYNDEHALDDALQLVAYYQSALDGDYRVLSLLGLDQDFTYKYHVLGVIRSSSSIIIEIPEITSEHSLSFPPTLEELEDILEFVNYNDYQRLIAGIVMNRQNYARLERSVTS